MRIAFFGTPDFAAQSLAALLASRHDVVVVVTQPDRPRGRGQRVTASPVKALAEAYGVPVHQPTRLRDEQWLDELRAFDLDLGVVAAYGRLLPDALLAIPRLGMINVHASLLPRYRGASPIHQAVIAGDTETGVTIMRVVSELDAGPMLARVQTPIGIDETTGDVEARLARLGAELLVSVVDRLADGPVDEEPQDDAAATFAPRLEKRIGLVDWSRPAAEIHNLVRGLQPWPGAWTYLRGQRIALRQTRLRDAVRDGVAEHVGHSHTPPPPPTPPTTDAGSPGTLVVEDRDTLGVLCGDGRILDIVALQPEGRRVMTAREFLAGRPVDAGAAFDAGPP